ncbi:MAG: phospholipid scramblase-related protein [Pseudanabaenaceae cyanobacterium bins.68]|nr:phospholipid scramblase-related protein [Pseudanabaenaceae cyanobacterium bins.68]
MSSLDFIDTLVQAKQIYVRQQVEIGELFGYETRNRYGIQTQAGREFCYCKEPQRGWQDSLARLYLGHWRTFDLVATDNLSRPVFRIHHPWHWLLHRGQVFDQRDRYVGCIQQQFGWWNRKLVGFDANGTRIFSLRSPLWQPWHFPLTQAGRPIALINKQWSGLAKEMFTDADHFQIEFIASSLNFDRKLLILASALLIDLMYFERKAR